MSGFECVSEDSLRHQNRIRDLEIEVARLNHIIKCRDEQLTTETQLSSKFCREKEEAEAKVVRLRGVLKLARVWMKHTPADTQREVDSLIQREDVALG